MRCCGLILVAYQEGPVCWSNVDWDQEEVAGKTGTIWSFEEASMEAGMASSLLGSLITSRNDVDRTCRVSLNGEC